MRATVKWLTLSCSLFLSVVSGAVGQNRVMVHVLSPTFSPDGDTLVFDIGVYNPVNLNDLLQGRASELVCQQIGSAPGLQLRYSVSRAVGNGQIDSGTVPFSAPLRVHVPLETWDGKGRLRIKVSALGDGWTDVTSVVNGIPGTHTLPFGEATVERARTKTGNLGYLATVSKWLRMSVKKGGIISYILILTFLWGLTISTLYVYRLFLSPGWSPHAIRTVAKRLNTELRVLADCGGSSDVVYQFVCSIAEKARRLERGVKGGRVSLRGLRSLENHSQAIVAQVSDDLVGARLRVATRGEWFGRILAYLPTSLESLWNASVLAPLLGLLGTVIGISSAFQGVRAISVLKDPGAAMTYLSSGINKALYTTVHGLIVGISFMFIFYICTRRARAIQTALRELGEQTYKRYLWEIAKAEARVTE